MKFLHIKGAFSKTVFNIAATLIVGAIYYYVNLPALNIRDTNFYTFIAVLCLIYFASAILISGVHITGGYSEYFTFVKNQCKIPLIVLLLTGVLFALGTVSSMVVFRAGAYSQLLKVVQGDFTKEVQEISFNRIPMLDKESAQRLGDRKLGELSDMVSQFEVASDYTQINYKNRPVRVTPLEYGDLFKWFNNLRRGLPAYVVIDMVSQDVDVIRLQTGMKYSYTDHFGRYLMRYLRFQFPTYMFDKPRFEIDEDGTPFWICPRIVKRVGLFGGTDIFGAVLINAVTGETKYYETVPSWVDGVFSADLIVEQYNYHGRYSSGFINSIIGQRGVTVTTDGYNYIAMNDDVYIYTGITSVGSDQSNIGFIYTNQRTKDTKLYSSAGATENSAMSSAQGVVQHLNYKATFPLLLNISSQPTYFMALKDNARLVKMYAMVNVGQYQIVATGTTVQECQLNYIKLLVQNNITKVEIPTETEAKGKIAEIRSAVRNGNSFYYIRLEGNPLFYAVPAAESELVVVLNVGDNVLIKYDESTSGEIRMAYSIVRTAPEPQAT